MKVFATISTMLVAMLSVAAASPQWCTHGCVSRIVPIKWKTNKRTDMLTEIPNE